MDPDGLDPSPPYKPGEVVWVRARDLIAGRELLDTKKVTESYLKSTQDKTRPPKINIYENGVIENGNSRARVAGHFDELIEAHVLPGKEKGFGNIMTIPYDNGLPPFEPRPNIVLRVGQGIRNFVGRLFTMGRNSGSGGGPAAFVTIGLGAGATADGLRSVMPYAQTVKTMGRDLQNDPEHGEIPVRYRWRPRNSRRR